MAEKSVELQDAQAAKRNLEKDISKLNRDYNDVKKELARTKDVLKTIEDKVSYNCVCASGKKFEIR